MWALKILRLLIGLCFYPAAAIAGFALWKLVLVWHPSGEPIGRSTIWLFGGIVAWPILHFTLPRSLSLYVLAHELSHGLVAWCMGASVGKLRVTEHSGGSIEVSESNFLISLAPYILPFYTLLVFIAYAIASLFPSLAFLQPLWMAAVGLTWSYHFTFTLWALAQDQADIREEGIVFSYGFIVLANLLLLSLTLVLFASPTIEEWISFLQEGWAWIRNWFPSPTG